MQSTLHLSHPLVSNLRIVNRATRAAITDSGSYAVDVRNGLVRLNAEDLDAAYPSGVVVGGYFYEWFLPEDLEFHARFVAQEHMMSRGSDTTVADLPAVELNVIAMGTVTQALWSLLSEFATEYDVINPEGISVPVRQRFQQVMQLFQVWQKKYEEGATALNVGFNRISVTEIRRVSRLTGRLVPPGDRAALAAAIEACAAADPTALAKAVIGAAKLAASIAAMWAHAGRVRVDGDPVDIACTTAWDAIRADIKPLAAAAGGLATAPDRVAALRAVAPLWPGGAPAWSAP